MRDGGSQMTPHPSMPEWPEKEDFDPRMRPGSDAMRVAEIKYLQARADAWEARCRALHKAIERFMASELAKKNADYGCVDCIAEALEAIGPLP